MQDFGELAEKLRRSTVQVLDGRCSGSGVLWNDRGLVITNAHVVGRSSTQVDLWDGTRATARPLALSHKCDLAALQIVSCGSAEAAVIGDSNSVRSGDLVVAVGNPLGFIGAASTGVIHRVAALPGFGVRSWIQSSVRLAPGNSGGPLASAKGEVIGINTMVAASGRSLLALAVPVSTVLSFIGGCADSTLGVTGQPVKAERGALGLLVLEISPGGAADRASILPGDMLTGANGSPFRSVGDLANAIASAQEGRLTLQFRRGGAPRERTVTVQLGTRHILAA
jgi:serine protease Do